MFRHKCDRQGVITGAQIHLNVHKWKSHTENINTWDVSTWLSDTLNLPNTFITHNSTQLAHDLNKIKIKESID
jgi:hypothetical protein